MNQTDKMDKRPTWDEYFCEIARVTAQRSSCERLGVGCVIVKNNRIVSQGYNGFIAGLPHTSVVRNDHEQATVHAEQNAIVDCARRGVSCEQATAYITHFPCLNCMKLLIASGIQKVNYLSDYKNDPLVYEFSKLSNVELVQCKLK